MKNESQTNPVQYNLEQINDIFKPLSVESSAQMKSLEEKLQNFKCSKNQEAIMMCCSQFCDKESPLCGKKKCQCKKIHQKCLNYFHFQHFINIASEKNSKKSELITTIEKVFDNLIDQLSNLRQKAIQAANFVFFNLSDQQFLEKVNNLDLNQIHGKDLFRCSFNTSHKIAAQKEKKNLDTMKKSLESFKKKLTKQIEQFEGNLFIEKLLMKKSQMKIDTSKINFIDSEIITSEQVPILYKFFKGSSFKQITLLYRASINDYSTQKFWDLCTNIPNTLVVILTQSHKVIGGYTPVPWKNYEKSHQSIDPSGESFIFSLTEEQKFGLKQSKLASYFFNRKWGPQFGKLFSGDLSISDNCNQDPSSFCFYGNEYASEKNPDTKVDIEKFTGQKSQYFRIIEWQVFQLIF